MNIAIDESVEIIVEEEDAGRRLDAFLAGRLTAVSRSRWRKAIEEGGVRVEGSAVKPGRRLAPGERVDVRLPRPEAERPRPEEIPLDFIYRDESLVAVNKPPGLLVHPVRAGQGGTLVNALLHHLGSLPETASPLRPGIVHRLDRDTSGVMVVARTAQAWRGLVRQFKARTVEKEYLALVRGRPPRREGECDFPLGRSPKRRTKMSVRYAGGRRARTVYRVEESFPGFSLLRLGLETGRTHQIRVHLAQLGCPVLGDPDYGGRRGEGLPVPARQLLHSHRLKILHPADGRPREWSAPLPADMEETVALLRARSGTG